MDNSEKMYQLVTISVVLADTTTHPDELIEAMREYPLTHAAFVVAKENGRMELTEAECEHILKFYR